MSSGRSRPGFPSARCGLPPPAPVCRSAWRRTRPDAFQKQAPFRSAQPGPGPLLRPRLRSCWRALPPPSSSRETNRRLPSRTPWLALTGPCRCMTSGRRWRATKWISSSSSPCPSPAVWNLSSGGTPAAPGTRRDCRALTDQFAMPFGSARRTNRPSPTTRSPATRLFELTGPTRPTSSPHCSRPWETASTATRWHADSLDGWNAGAGIRCAYRTTSPCLRRTMRPCGSRDQETCCLSWRTSARAICARR